MKYPLIFACLFGLIVMFAADAKALTPDEIVLVVNSKVPASKALAEFYAEQRKIPAGRILAIDLPFPQEDISAAVYDAQVVPQVRAFLSKEKLQSKVKCLVTFWGVPIRVQRRPTTPSQNQEMAERDRELTRVQAEVSTVATAVEAAARGIDPTFKPGVGQKFEEVVVRAETAAKLIRAKFGTVANKLDRDKAYDAMISGLERLAGRGVAVQEAARPDLQALHPLPYTQEELVALQQDLTQAKQELNQLQRSISERASRDKTLELVKSKFGLLQYVNALRTLRQFVDGNETEAAFDSELSLVWLDNIPRQRWIPNFLYHGVTAGPGTPQVLMVTRIDGPTEEIAKRIIVDSMKAEADGLTGTVALDARGNHTQDAYAQYDQTIRDLAELLKTKTTLDVRLDDKDALFPVNSEKDVALYCGWYSLRNYVKSFTFQPGAVGFHVASLEMLTLRTVGERGWTANLLKDGVSSTLGPVAEPYLHTFPRADEFFPLLLTGKLPLAEVYWKTCPVASWMQCFIGDPLYTPYAKNAPMKVEDLPIKLQAIFTAPTTRRAVPADLPPVQ